MHAFQRIPGQLHHSIWVLSFAFQQEQETTYMSQRLEELLQFLLDMITNWIVQFEQGNLEGVAYYNLLLRGPIYNISGFEMAFRAYH